MEKEVKISRAFRCEDAEVIQEAFNGSAEAKKCGAVKMSGEKAGNTVFVTIDTDSPAALISAAAWVRRHFCNVSQIRNSAGDIIFVRTIY